MEQSRRDLEDLRRALVRVAGEAASYLRDMFGSEDVLGVVTIHEGDEGMRVDIESEKLMMELLSVESLNGIVVGEEHGTVKLGSYPYVFVIDPLDGSKNYASLIPWSAVSIAAAPIDDPRLDRIIAGVVAPVFRWPPISFARGLGVYEGEARPPKRRVRPKTILAYVEEPRQATILFNYLSLRGENMSVRALGSASLEAVWAGLARVEIFMDLRGRLRVYDLAAALGIVKEAGAYVYVENNGVNLLRPRRLGLVAVTAYNDAWKRFLAAIDNTVKEKAHDPQHG